MDSVTLAALECWRLDLRLPSACAAVVWIRGLKCAGTAETNSRATAECEGRHSSAWTIGRRNWSTGDSAKRSQQTVLCGIDGIGGIRRLAVQRVVTSESAATAVAGNSPDGTAGITRGGTWGYLAFTPVAIAIFGLREFLIRRRREVFASWSKTT
jgi:hypothetical protein